ncbi:MAG TPA: tRNA (N6-isopentenyl adenosine(37)-C2)-methylthiotransferase MiaB [Bryobacteraceae bacterium]|nr:tRNA (N6-isopentenyl adenosine(37)-C2)-methylthiotransferase MiaB [Bryobacteraceae bacterium]HOQ44972.1 tRNA (N6-isopentenyl adenosine(37)-C2)-methylthiotransferase MiaB [Bryobacteraceae bacterium]HPQ14613.1 tRNA (N6-isopentenyl adenosine(37)-C2)-methylthiotransferase MiaB [Bryobacteraceae bacterium]HPU72018.1 tRNA (N6-isopentenyl adenosine(37)-C2)-methylthiotransferase MiaB [Bryobacteraceae bacterium]
MKTFYIETFGCQMNVHDSEKVVGTLIAQGYRQVPKPEEADLVLYNTCSIRDKAEQKVFSRLQQFKREAGKGKTFAVLGCVAQQEGERIFERAPHVSLVCGSASYTRLPEMLVQLEAGARRVTGLDRDTQETFETPFTRRDNPHRAYITIIEGCDKSCAYCVVPFTRGRERSRASDSIMEEARRLADEGYTEIQLLGQNVNSYRDPSSRGWDFATLLARVAEVEGIRRVRFTTSHPRDFVKEIVDAIDANPVLANHVHLPVQSGSTRVLERMQRQYTREEYLERIAWLKASPRNVAITTDIIVGFPGETEEDFEQTLSLLDEVQYDAIFSFKYSPRPNTPALALDGQVPEEEKGRRLMVLQEKQRGIQLRLHEQLVGTTQEVLVEGYNRATGQWIGRTAENRVVNFTLEGSNGHSVIGQYMHVHVTRAGPNSLAGYGV